MTNGGTKQISEKEYREWRTELDNMVKCPEEISICIIEKATPKEGDKYACASNPKNTTKKRPRATERTNRIHN